MIRMPQHPIALTDVARGEGAHLVRTPQDVHARAPQLGFAFGVRIRRSRRQRARRKTLRAKHARHRGRDRATERRWGPRTLDIDLIAYDDMTVNDPDLTLPHPRLFERAFVLVPLNDIASERIIAGVRIKDALAKIDASGIERLPAR